MEKFREKFGMDFMNEEDGSVSLNMDVIIDRFEMGIEQQDLFINFVGEDESVSVCNDQFLKEDSCEIIIGEGFDIKVFDVFLFLLKKKFSFLKVFFFILLRVDLEEREIFFKEILKVLDIFL